MKTILFGESLKGRIARILLLFVLFLAPASIHYEFIMVDGHSMYPTYHDEEIVILRKRSSLGANWLPNRYDVIEINTEDERWIKRVVGLPGDHIKYGTGRLSINNERESRFEYLDLNEIPRSVVISVDLIIPEGSVYIIGDNRFDSAHKLIYLEEITGKVVY